MYGDFFDPPKGVAAPSKGKDKGKGKKGKGVKFAKEAEPETDASRDVMGRVKGDLFDSDDEEVEEKSKSSLELR